MKKSKTGTNDWAEHYVNFCTGCSHNCQYCYAKSMAIQYKRLTAKKWPFETIRMHDVRKKHKKYPGTVMIPSSHDITPNNLDAGIIVIRKLLAADNRLLIVSKPHLDCIRGICDEFGQYRDLFKMDDNGRRQHRLIFRFSIGACDDAILSYWEPGAPAYDERMAALQYAYQHGFQTSVSVEPMLDAFHIDDLINDLSPFVTDSIWIGKMNHIGRFGKNADVLLKKAIKTIQRGQTDSNIKAIYQRHKQNPMIKWKKEIKKIVGIPISKQNGLDI